MSDIKNLTEFLRSYYYPETMFPLHRPIISDSDKSCVLSILDSGYVSSVGAEIEEFENKICLLTGAESCVAVTNGTAALHASLNFIGCEQNDYVITQAMSFVATANAISQTGASPIFLDVDQDTLSLSPNALSDFLSKNTYVDLDGRCRLVSSDKIVKACVPMHTFGAIGRIIEIRDICHNAGIILIEDAAEALGSTLNGKHAGTFGKLGTLSFNGNKIITTGGGGAILCSLEDYASIKHLVTTAKKPHRFEYFHDRVGFNYRMPNINAALGLGQLTNFAKILEEKSNLAKNYIKLFSKSKNHMFNPDIIGKSNNWLNTLLCDNLDTRNRFINACWENNIQARAVWEPLNTLPPYTQCLSDSLNVTKNLREKIINLPSSVPLNKMYNNCE